MAVVLTLCVSGPCPAQTTAQAFSQATALAPVLPPQQPLAVQTVVGNTAYTAASPVGYVKTSSGLQVVLAPSPLSGS